jgi:hypothetical protein
MKKHTLDAAKAAADLQAMSEELGNYARHLSCFPDSAHARRCITLKLKKLARTMQRMHMQILAHGWRQR